MISPNQLAEKQFFYDPQLYNLKSAEVLVPFLVAATNAKSVVDIGCGIGTWLSIVQKAGITDILGVDASRYEPGTWMIPSDKYVQADLTKTLNIERKFDLAFCLEVAEHLPPVAAHGLVEGLTGLADTIVFSAAIPGQGGSDHLNEQWPEYWQALFNARGFQAYDPFRIMFWENQSIEFWYRQNLVIFSKIDFSGWHKPTVLASLVHPAVLSGKQEKIRELHLIKRQAIFEPSIPFALRTLAKALFVTPVRKKFKFWFK